MGCGQFIVLGFVLACVSLSAARLYGSGVLTRRGAGVQKSKAAEAKPAAAAAAAERKHSRWSAQQTSRLQKKQAEAVLPPFSWKFPEDPVNPVRELPVDYKPQQPVKSDRLAVRCGQSKVFVEVSQDLLGLGKLIKPEELTLGGCPAMEIDETAHVLVFESELHSCGSKLVMTDEVFIYAFVLLYNPRVLARGLITRGLSATIGVECHYKRKNSVSIGPLKGPDNEIIEHPHFSLKLKSDDWTAERFSNKYILADVINLEVAVMQLGNMPLRVLVDYCVAARKPGFNYEPKQEFIKNHGCLGGRYSPSRFMPQSQPETLQFQVEASSFHPLRMLYLTCSVKAIPASNPTTIEQKLCSFSDGRWQAVRGKDQFCNCCAATCGMRKARDLASYKMDVKWDAELVVGPLIIQ